MATSLTGADQWTPLGFALEQGYAPSVRALLELNASVEQTFWQADLGTGPQSPPLRHISGERRRKSNEEDAKILGRWWTPLGFALEKGNAEIANILLEHKASVEQTFVDQVPKPRSARRQIRHSPYFRVWQYIGGVSVFGPVPLLD